MYMIITISAKLIDKDWTYIEDVGAPRPQIRGAWNFTYLTLSKEKFTKTFNLDWSDSWTSNCKKGL